MLIGLLGLLTSAASKALSDTLTFGISLAVMTNIVQFAHSNTVADRQKVEPSWRKWGPFYIITFASLASMVDISRQILLDSNSPALMGADGSKQAFNFGKCGYTASATALAGSTAESCPPGPIPVAQAGAFGLSVNAWLNSAAMDSICSTCSWAATIFTIVGFMWLADVIPWFRHKMASVQKHGLTAALLEAEGCAADGSCERGA